MKEEFRNHSVWIIIACVLAAGIIVSSVVLSKGIGEIKGSDSAITITGSAKKQIKSDLVIWRGSYLVQGVDLSKSYTELKKSEQKVKNYITGQGIDEKDIVISSINTCTNYRTLPNGQMTNEVQSYRLMQNIEIKSSDVDKLTNISRQATELINQGVEFQSFPPEYYYTKLADLKISMLGLAAEDARNRADQIAKSTGSQIGELGCAKVGVFQITVPYSTDVSDRGIYDTSSIDKEITAVMTCEFKIEK